MVSNWDLNWVCSCEIVVKIPQRDDFVSKMSHLSKNSRILREQITWHFFHPTKSSAHMITILSGKRKTQKKNKRKIESRTEITYHNINAINVSKSSDFGFCVRSLSLVPTHTARILVWLVLCSFIRSFVRSFVRSVQFVCWILSFSVSRFISLFVFISHFICFSSDSHVILHVIHIYLVRAEAPKRTNKQTNDVYGVHAVCVLFCISSYLLGSEHARASAHVFWLTSETSLYSSVSCVLMMVRVRTSHILRSSQFTFYGNRSSKRTSKRWWRVSKPKPYLPYTQNQRCRWGLFAVCRYVSI